MQPHRVLVVGGGYAGVLAATRIARKGRDRVAVTLVNEGPEFIERVRLPEYTCGGREIAHDLRSALGLAVRLVLGRVVALDPGRSNVVLASGAPESFDTCLVATGSVCGDGGIPGVRAHTCNIATRQNADATRERLRALAHRGRVLICGGGLTAIELAAELAETRVTLQIGLVTAKGVGQGLSSKGRQIITRHLSERGVALHDNARVTGVDAAGIMRADGRRMEADLVVWCGGFEASSLPRGLGLEIDRGGRAVVDQYLRSTSHPNVFVVGDSAAIAPTPLRMGCVAALPMAIHAADGVIRGLRGKPPEAFRFRFVLQCISLGRRAGLVQFVHADDSPREWTISGKTAAAIKELLCRYAARRPFRDRLQVPAAVRDSLSQAGDPREETSG